MFEKLKFETKNLGKSKSTSGDMYNVKVTRLDNGKTIEFDYNDNYLNKSDEYDFIDAILIDALFAEEIELEGSLDKLNEKAKAVYDDCVKNAKKLHYMFSENEIIELTNEISNREVR